MHLVQVAMFLVTVLPPENAPFALWLCALHGALAFQFHSMYTISINSRYSLLLLFPVDVPVCTVQVRAAVGAKFTLPCRSCRGCGCVAVAVAVRMRLACK